MSEPKKEEKKTDDVDPKKKEGFKRSVRSSWIGCMLYPDNFYHMEFLEYLKTMGITHLYIKHQPEQDEKKEHIHLMIHFDYPYTVSGFVKSVGTGWFIEVGKDEKDKPIYKPIPPQDRSTYSNAVEMNIIGHAENITSPQGNYIYYLHKDFKSRFKIQYKDSDVVKIGDMGIINKITAISYVNRELMYQELEKYGIQSINCIDFMRRVLADGRTDIIDYVSSHSYFVKEFFIKYFK